MNDRAKYKGRMAIYAMAGVYLLAQAYYMYKISRPAAAQTRH
mgnify:CR=1 FL=1